MASTETLSTKQLIKRQLGLAGFIERFVENTLKIGKDKITAEYLKSRIELLENYWSYIQTAHWSIVLSEGGTETDYGKSDVYEKAELNYVQARAKLLTEVTTIDGTPSLDNSFKDEPSALTLLQQLQMPKVDLPKFSGNRRDWEGYRDLYTSLVHDKRGVSAVHKLQLLRGSLTDVPLRIVNGFANTEAGYEAAWEALLSRYDDPREILTFHLLSVLDLPTIHKPSAASIHTMISTVKQAVRSAQSLNRAVDGWDDWLITIIVKRLDSNSKMLWESSLKSKKDFPSYKQLIEFLEGRARSIAAASPETNASPIGSTQSHKSKLVAFSSTSESHNASFVCSICQAGHTFPYCARFRSWPVAKRRQYVTQQRCCLNCLKMGHSVQSCPSFGRCQQCRGKHHTSLHVDETKGVSTADKVTKSTISVNSGSPSEHIRSNTLALKNSTRGSVLLATARVNLENPQGSCISIRALLDSGSEATFLTERMAQLLRLPRKKVHVPITGLQDTRSGNASHEVSLTLKSHDHSISIPISGVLVLPSLTSLSHPRPVSSDWPHLEGLALADPRTHSDDRQIDMIIGADLYGSLLRGGTVQGPPGTPSAQLTALGWVLMGPVASSNDSRSIAVHHALTLADLSRQVQRLWELDEVGYESIPSPEDDHCEKLFRETHRRDSNGRFTVRLPVRPGALAKLGDSRSLALRQFFSLERRLRKDSVLRNKYCNFMTDYITQGHMELAPPIDSKVPQFYLPHHPVMKRSDPHGKVRVVFNASAHPPDGLSLNDCLFTGPKHQDDLWLVLTRWRLFEFVWTADIVQMFRQIGVAIDDQDLQRVFWRSDPSEPLREFRLTTVTYGTVPAPHLAQRPLLHLATVESKQYPIGAQIILRRRYIDDFLGGGETCDAALEARRQLIGILNSGGFRLSKWSANHPDLVPEEQQPERVFSDPTCTSTLGVLWSAHSDLFSLRGVPVCSTERATKRSVLSDVSKFFDPLGWAAPVLIYGKVLLQQLWSHNLKWDDPLPEQLNTRWSDFASTLGELDSISLPRYVQYSSENCQVDIIGFSDASERAYAATVYLRCTIGDLIFANLLVAKTRVAPIKPQSIPRLELCGAVLVSKLVHAVASGLDLAAASKFYWTDASVVLSWLQSHPSRWKAYVAHRVASIHELAPADRWFHVNTHENPADLSTRGITPADLLHSRLWWHGPSWLSQPSASWPTTTYRPEDDAVNAEAAVSVLLSSREVAEKSIFERFSSLSKLLKVISICFRWIKRTRLPKVKLVGFVKAEELTETRIRCVILAQSQDFLSEIRSLQDKQPILSKSVLSSLTPFISQDGILRVGGRLSFANLPFEERNPPILNGKNHFCLLLMRNAHRCTLHGGPQVMRSFLRNFWIIGAGRLAKSVARQCVRCTRFRSTAASQLMGQLPSDRVRESRPFSASGVDFAGPFNVVPFRGRGRASHKGYVSLFICLSTKAIHLELVSGLSSAAFIAAFQRFIARRGHCQRLYSDNGTNFRGADRVMQTMLSSATKHYQEIDQSLASLGTVWSFIPPSSPHFGGLWEAGVRSVKHHLRRVVGDQILAYEEMATLLCNIEACLNSRPLYPISNDAHDLVSLTPGHFLIGSPLINMPEKPSSDDLRAQALDRWHHVSRLRDHIWTRWSQEYLHHLQQRSKWRRPQENLKEGDMVLIKTESFPPARWPLARVVRTHPGPDGLVRVVTLRTANGLLKRPIAKLCLLPVAETKNAS